MSILTAENIGVSFGAFDLFRDVTVTVANDSKIGLIGPNGVGKTTLLLILAGINQPTTGSIHLARGRKMGYLRQEAMDAFADRKNTVFAEMLSVFDDLKTQQEKLHQFEERLSKEYSDELLEEYGRQQETFERAGGYDYELRIRQTLDGLGLGKKTWEMPLRNLSGGQKTRALLARLLLEKPDFLMLDEPTNHLDIEAVEWLEHTLQDWQGAVLIVSHDRFFLDNSVNTIWEMHSTGMETFSGTYSDYLLQRQERWDYYERVFKEEKERLVKEADFIQRNWVRASTHARALGMLRKVSREIAMVEKFGIMSLRDGTRWSETGLAADRPLDVIEAIRRINAISSTRTRPPQIKPRLIVDHNSGNIVLRSQGAVIGYPRHPLFTIKNLELRRGECAALIGPNGSGKTTFLKVILGQLKPLQGEVQTGAGLKIGYFAQVHDSLQGDRSVIEELIRHKEMHPGEARSYLAQYQFREEDVFKPLQALSGGEKSRLALAILALEGTNTLILDEPTNHLDIASQEALQEVLDAYSGTILLVSHDRYLINRLATQIWEIRDGVLIDFKGSYRDYILKAAGAKQQVARASQASQVRQALLPGRPLIRADGRAVRKRLEEIGRLEGRIREQESAVQRLSGELQRAGGNQSHERIHKISWQVAQAQAELERLIAEWEKLAV